MGSHWDNLTNTIHVLSLFFIKVPFSTLEKGPERGQLRVISGETVAVLWDKGAAALNQTVG